MSNIVLGSATQQNLLALQNVVPVPGDKVILNGWGLGETHLGGYAEKARVKSDWLVRLPARTARAARWRSVRQVIPPCWR